MEGFKLNEFISAKTKGAFFVCPYCGVIDKLNICVVERTEKECKVDEYGDIYYLYENCPEVESIEIICPNCGSELEGEEDDYKVMWYYNEEKKTVFVDMGGGIPPSDKICKLIEKKIDERMREDYTNEKIKKTVKDILEKLKRR